MNVATPTLEECDESLRLCLKGVFTYTLKPFPDELLAQRRLTGYAAKCSHSGKHIS